jgi:lipid-A-disaccharide synthase
MDEWREWLYPLGFLSSLIFSARFIFQWIQSEKAQKSVVNPSFWKISLAGNLLLTLHALVQIQFHVSLVQASNAVISWRNLNLMNAPQQRKSLLFTIAMMSLTLLSITAFYWLQSLYLPSDYSAWFRSPLSGEEVHPLWHALGAIGLLLFNSRFWIQWCEAERSQESVLGLTFWWTSLIGGLFSAIYFIKLGDPVNLLGPAFGMIPYARNLMLIYKNKRTSATTEEPAT